MLFVERSTVKSPDRCGCLFGCFVLYKCEASEVSVVHHLRCAQPYPSEKFFSFRGMKIASSLVFPTVLSFFSRNLTSFCLLSSGTTGRPSMTTNVSRPCSSLTSYWAWRSMEYLLAIVQLWIWSTTDRWGQALLQSHFHRLHVDYWNSATWWMRRGWNV